MPDDEVRRLRILVLQLAERVEYLESRAVELRARISELESKVTELDSEYLFKMRKRCETCAFWQRSNPGVDDVVIELPGTGYELGECTRQESKRMPRAWIGGDCGKMCDRYEPNRAKLETLPDVPSCQFKNQSGQ